MCQRRFLRTVIRCGPSALFELMEMMPLPVEPLTFVKLPLLTESLVTTKLMLYTLLPLLWTPTAQSLRHAPAGAAKGAMARAAMDIAIIIDSSVYDARPIVTEGNHPSWNRDRSGVLGRLPIPLDPNTV